VENSGEIIIVLALSVAEFCKHSGIRQPLPNDDGRSGSWGNGRQLSNDIETAKQKSRDATCFLIVHA